jgi:hypothetical protein
MILCVLFGMQLQLQATFYKNGTEDKIFVVTNVSAQKRQTQKGKKRTWWNWNKRKYGLSEKQEAQPVVVTIEPGKTDSLYNEQGDEITIMVQGMSDKRKLFPTNNSFNYVMTLNNFNKKFERIVINYAQ